MFWAACFSCGALLHHRLGGALICLEIALVALDRLLAGVNLMQHLGLRLVGAVDEIEPVDQV